MSTNYITPKTTKTFQDLKKDLLGNRIEGIFKSESKQETPTQLCVTDGKSYIWAYDEDPGVTFERYGRQDLDKILDILEAWLDQELIDEYDERYDELMED